MNPLPRVLGLFLLLILIALAVMLAGQWQLAPSDGVTRTGSTRTPAVRLVEFSQRAAFPLALTGVALATGLLASLALISNRNSAPPEISKARTEIDALTQLAKTSAAQHQELAQERSERQRAEADASLNQQRLSEAAEDKVRLGRDLHDGIIQSLYAAGLTIESARAVAASDPEEADRRLSQCRERLNLTIRDVRAYIAGLAPEQVRQAGFTQAVEVIVEELSAGRDVEFEFRIDDSATNLLSAEQTTEALQIAREAISNSLRHSDAKHITVRLHSGEGMVSLLVQDDGRGFDQTGARAGYGLRNMQARAAQNGGTLRLESAVGKGTRVVLTLPADPKIRPPEVDDTRRIPPF
jgi:signal transduction histidine kinase